MTAPPERTAEPASLVQREVDITNGPYAIQIAAYVPNSHRGRQLLARLRQRSEAAFLTPIEVGGRGLVRLLIGSFPSRDEALRHAQMLKKQGIVEEFIISRMFYAVELAVLNDPAQVDQAMAQLGERGRFAYVQGGPSGQIRLLAGAFENEDDARFFAEQLGAGRTEGRVIRR